MARPGGHRDPRYLADVIDASGVTVCTSCRRCCARSSRSALRRVARSLRDVMASGEALPPDLVAQFYATLPEAAAAQPLRADRMRGGRELLGVSAIERAAGRRADRTTGGEHAAVRARFAMASRAPSACPASCISPACRWAWATTIGRS